jgi:putative SOS response-associated peptidase YedK
LIELIVNSSSNTALSRAFESASGAGLAPSGMVFSGEEITVITQSEMGTQAVSAVWGAKLPQVSRNLITQFHLKRTLHTKPFNIFIHNNRCAVPVNCFCLRYGERTYLIRLLNHRIFALGGILKAVKGAPPQLTLIETAAPDVLQSITPTVPVLFAPDRMDKWLGQKEMHEVMHTADRSGNYWFDYFEVDPHVLDRTTKKIALLKPLGLSFQQVKLRNEKLQELQIKASRANRAGSK